MHPARDAESVLGLGVHDRMSSGDDAASLADLVGATVEDGSDDLLGEVSREPGHVQREEHLPAHGVHIRHRVGGSDGAVDVRVIDDGREEIHRLDDGEVLAHPVDGGIIALAEPHEKVRVAMLLEPPQHVLEISRTHLGGSPRARRVAGEPDLLAARRIGQLAVHRSRPIAWRSDTSSPRFRYARIADRSRLIPHETSASCQGRAPRTTTTSSSGISSLYSIRRTEGRAPTTPSSARTSGTQSASHPDPLERRGCARTRWAGSGRAPWRPWRRTRARRP